MPENKSEREKAKERALTYEEAEEIFGDYWILRDDFDWDTEPPRALVLEHRLPIIIRGLAIGKTREEIATRCGVTRRTIYTDMNGVEAEKIAEEMLLLQLQDIGKLARFPDPQSLLAAMNFRDRLLQKLIPRKVLTRGSTRIEGELEVSHEPISEESLSRYIDTIVKIAMEEEAGAINQDPV